MNKSGQIGKYPLLRRRWSPLVLSVLVPLILLTVVMLSASAMEAEPAGQMEPQTGGGFNSVIQVTNISYTATGDIAVDYSDGISATEPGVPAGGSVTFPQEWEGHDPGWAGGATIASSGEQIVALVSQHASDADKESIYNAFGFYEAPTSLVLPLLFKNYYGLNSTVFVQNVGEGNATIEVNYSDGVVRTEAITPGGTAILAQAEEAHVDGWHGSALVSADQPIVAVVNVESETVFRTYRGFAYAFGMSSVSSQTAYQYWLPLTKRNWGDAGDTTSILVYNLDYAGLTANIEIAYYDQDGVLVATDMGTIPPGGSASYYQGDNAGLPDGFRGSAVISSDQPVVALVGQQALDSSYYEGFSEGVYDAVLPLVQKAYYGCDTEIAIQNTGVVSVDVNVAYVGEAEGTPVEEWEYVYGLQPNASVLLEQAVNADLPEMFLGHAKVDATGPVAVVVNRVCSGTLSTYNGVDLEMVEGEAHAPAVMYEYQPGGADEVQLTVNVEPADAESAGCYVDQYPGPPYAADDVVELTATPCTGWVFDYWSGDAAVTGTLAFVTMDSSKVVTAHFTAEGPQGNVIGKVTTPEGDDLPPAYDDWGSTLPPAMIEVRNVDTWEIWEADTNQNGEFSLDLPDGDYELLAKPACDTNLAVSYTKSLPVEFVVLASAGTTDLGSIKLTYPRIWGWVVGPDGNRVSTHVDVWNDDWTYQDYGETYWNDAAEWYKPFRFGGMPEGHYSVQSGPPYDNTTGLGSSNVEEFDVASGSWYDPSSTEQITLYIGAANFVGTLLYTDTTTHAAYPAQWVDVRVRSEDWEASDWFEAWATTGENGQFAFSGLMTETTYVVEVFLPDDLAVDWAPPDPVTFTLESPDQQITRTLYLKSDACNKYALGKVSYENGDPVGDALVAASHETSGQWADTPTDDAGEYEFCLGDGLWRMWVEPTSTDTDWYFDSTLERLVWFSPTEEAESKTVNFTVTRSSNVFAHVTGVITTPDGSLLPSGVAWMELCTEDGECFIGNADSDGYFSLWAPLGTYNAWVRVGDDTGFAPPLNNGKLVGVDDDPTDIGVFTLRRTADRNAHVHGRVIITPTGRGLEDVTVEAWTEDDWASTETITDGFYSLDLFPGYWEGGPMLTDEQKEQYVVLPPQYKGGHLEAGETAENVNFYLARRNATISGRVVDEDGSTITDADAIVLAEHCADGDCRTVAEDEVKGGSFELHVVGGTSYTLSVWLPTGGYMPGPPVPVEVGVNEDKTGVLLTLLEAGTRIHGYLEDGKTGERVQVDSASVYAVDSEGHWMEDTISRDKDSYELYLPTPVTDPVTVTLRLWVNPPVDPDAAWYIADPAKPSYPVVVEPGREQVSQDLNVIELDTRITGTVKMGSAEGDPVPYVEVFAEGLEGTDSEGISFEAGKTNKDGKFSMHVLPGEYVVGARLPADLAADYLPPAMVKWTDVSSNPVEIVLLPKTEDLEIYGSLSVTPTEALSTGTLIKIYGTSREAGFKEISASLGSEYHLPVASNTTWHVWAVYEDSANNDFYRCREQVVRVRGESVRQDLMLAHAFELPDSQCWTIDPDRSERLEFPRREDMLDLLPPMMTVKSGTFSGTVRICVTPKADVPEGQNLIGLAYDLEARDSAGRLIEENFNKYVRLEFYFDDEALSSVPIAPGYSYPTPEDLRPVYYSNVYNEWMELEDAFVDEEDMFATGKVDHFSSFGAMSSPGEMNEIYLPLVLRD